MAQTERLADRVHFGTAGMLRITIHDSARELRIKLEGKLSGLWVEELRQCWRTASSTTAGRTTSLDLSEVDFVDADGQSLLSDMHRQGVRVDAATPLIQSLVAEGIGRAGCVTVEEKPAGSPHVSLLRGKSGNR
jgi:ABC-type transporter Mla MlaB component